jgi:hypothetical protein
MHNAITNIILIARDTLSLSCLDINSRKLAHLFPIIHLMVVGEGVEEGGIHGPNIYKDTKPCIGFS